MYKEEKEKYDCNECVHYDCCCHSFNGCSQFEKRVNIVLEIDGVRHVLKPDDRCCICFHCSLLNFCMARSKFVCSMFANSDNFHFELEKNEE